MTRQKSGDREMAQALDYPRLNGRFIPGVVIVASPAPPTSVEHKLGRVPIGWSIVDRTNPAAIYRDSWDERHLVLSTSATTTCAVEVW